MKLLKTAYLPIVALLLSATSCNNDVPEFYGNEPQKLVVVADIAGNARGASRAAQGTDDDWSYTGFEDGDVMGFFSSGGNYPSGGGFDNIALQYNATLKQFSDVNNGATFSPTGMDGAKIYMYYPYSSNISTTGFELRRTGPSSGDTLRCVDFLDSYKIQVDGVLDGKRMALFGEFDHSFSELIIMRGEGFDNPPPGRERITAVLNNPVTNIRVEVESDNGWSVDPQLVYDPNNTHRLTQDQAYRWDAWWGKNYGTTVQDTIGRPAWYIIVPTIGSEVGKIRPGERSLVQYIELYDNEGNLQQVTALRLSGGLTKYVDAGWRYPMEISMKEMVPTVNPYKIEPWNQDVNLTDQRTRGINNMIEFEEWVREYNAYAIESSEERINNLLKYGDLYVDEEQNYQWHFYLLTDLNMAQYNPVNSGTSESMTILPVLKDILDGESTTLVNGSHPNHVIKGLSKTLVDNLQSSNGKITNITFEDPNVRRDTDTPIGIIANTITDGTVNNVTIDNGTLINLDGNAGFVTGVFNGGFITYCTLSGFMTSRGTGSGDYAKVVGTDPTGVFTFANNNAVGIVY